MSTPISDNSDATDQPSHRVAVYVDGLNLYYGLKSRGLRRYYWLDLRRLAERLLRPGQRLEMVRYFTARFLPRDDPEQPLRQDAYLKALATRPDLTIQYGYHLPKTITCRSCGASRETFEEKMTDVNIAIALFRDAVQDAFDTAIIISADSDLAGPIDAMRQDYPGKRVAVAFPPNRYSRDLANHATATFSLWPKTIARSQFPAQVSDANGYLLHRPARWN